MKINKRKPDFIFILAVLVGLGVIVTMMAQAGAESRVAVNKGYDNSLYEQAWSKTNNKMNQRLTVK